MRILFIFLATVAAIVTSQQEGGREEQHKCILDDSDTEGKCILPVWKEGSLEEIGKYLDCDWGSTEIHQEDAWGTFNKVYNEVVGLEWSTIPPKYGSNGFQMPVEIKFDEDVGRGVFTKVPIKKGDLIYISTNNAQFHAAQDYRNYLRSLPVALACDVLIWAFSRMLSAETELHIACVDLDEGSFINTAPVSSLECNMELGTETGLLKEGDDETSTHYGCDLKFYAKRDIQENEEIRADYGEFAEPHGWLEMGLWYYFSMGPILYYYVAHQSTS